MILEKEIINLPNVLDLKDYYSLVNRCKTQTWRFASKSSDRMPEYHLNHTILKVPEGQRPTPTTHYKNLDPLHSKILNMLNKKYKIFIKPYDIYYNSYKFGNEMEIHADKTTQEGLNRTIIIYLTETWLPEWHGETVFYDDQRKNIIKTIVPYPNSAVIADARIFHTAVPISKFCLNNRYILVFQTEIERKDI
jgi:hypothetical protein